MSRRLAISLSLFLFLLAVLAYAWLHFLTEPVLKKSKAGLVVELSAGMTAKQFIIHLSHKHPLSSTRMLLLLAKLSKSSRNFQAGIYQLSPHVRPLELFTKLSKGEVIHGQFTVVEGKTTKEVIAALKAAPLIKSSAGLATRWQAYLLAHQRPFEGQLLANSYQYVAGTDAFTLLARAHTSLLQALDAAWQTRAKDLPYLDSQQLLVAASIIEKETALTHERPLVSSVIVNRLKKGMRLQMDPTVIYGLGKHFTGRLNKKALRYDSPYNTYRYSGLPPGPIANIGQQSLFAASHPCVTDYFYFVLKLDGEHQFSKTLTEQRLAIAQNRKD